MVIYLSDGVCGIKDYCESPVTLMRDLFKYKKRWTLGKNIKLLGCRMKMDIEMSNLCLAPATTSRDDLIDAAESLNLATYSLYKKIRVEL